MRSFITVELQLVTSASNLVFDRTYLCRATSKRECHSTSHLGIIPHRAPAEPGQARPEALACIPILSGVGKIWLSAGDATHRAQAHSAANKDRGGDDADQDDKGNHLLTPRAS